MRSVGSTAARMSVGLLVIVLHLVVLMLILTTTRNRWQAGTDSRALTLIDIEPSKPEIPRKEVTPEPKMVTPPLGGSSTAHIPSTEESRAITAPAANPDWREAMGAAATAAVGRAIRDESYQALGPVEREKAGSGAAPSVFETPRRKAGDIDHDATQGRTLIWHDENCFTELRFPTIKDPNALVGAPNPPKCMRSIGEREARGDLFESIEKR